MDPRAQRLFSRARAVASGAARFPRQFTPRPMSAMLAGSLGDIGDYSILTDSNQDGLTPSPNIGIDPGTLAFNAPGTDFNTASYSGAASQSGGNVFLPPPQAQTDALNPGTLRAPDAGGFVSAPYSSGTGYSQPPLVRAPDSGGGLPSIFSSFFSPGPSLSTVRSGPMPVQTGMNPVVVLGLIGAGIAVIAAIMYEKK